MTATAAVAVTGTAKTAVFQTLPPAPSATAATRQEARKAGRCEADCGERQRGDLIQHAPSPAVTSVERRRRTGRTVRSGDFCELRLVPTFQDVVASGSLCVHVQSSQRARSGRGGHCTLVLHTLIHVSEAERRIGYLRGSASLREGRLRVVHRRALPRDRLRSHRLVPPLESLRMRPECLEPL